MWEIIASIGSFLSGLSIVTAFVVYWIEKQDHMAANIRKSLSVLQVLINEQSKLLQADYSFSFAEEFFSNNYVQHHLSEISEYIEDNPQLDLEDIKKHCNDTCKQLFAYPVSWKSQVYQNCLKNYTDLNSLLICDLAMLPDIVAIANILSKQVELLNDNLKAILIGDDFGINTVCITLKSNIHKISNSTFIKGVLAQRFIENSNNQYKSIQMTITVATEIINYLLDDISMFDETTLRKFVKYQKSQRRSHTSITVQEKTEKEIIRGVLTHIKTSKIDFTNLVTCFENLGKLAN